MKKNLNTLTLSGMMTGPILGSGIIFLPPLAFKALGAYALYAWITIMLLGAIFAYVFSKMTILTTSNEGMSFVIFKILGSKFRNLSANYLTTGVCFGPVAVALTAASFLNYLFGINEFLLAFLILFSCSVIVAFGVSVFSRLILMLSLSITILLIFGSTFTILNLKHLQVPSGLPPLKTFGSTMLILFWSINGWEVIGNYIEDVKNPRKTIMNAMKISLTAIIVVYMLTTFALQNYFFSNSKDANVQALLIPLFGLKAPYIFSILASALCICAFLSVVGAVSRQLTSRAILGVIPRIFSQKYVSLISLTLIHFIVLFLVFIGEINLQWIVSIANTFFIGNAVLGLFSAFCYLKGFFIKTAIGILLAMLIVMFLFSSKLALIFLVIVTCLSLY